MSGDVDTIIARVHSMSRGRTRFEGQPAHWDEVLVAEIDRLRAELSDADTSRQALQMDIAMANDALIEKEKEIQNLITHNKVFIGGYAALSEEIVRISAELARREDQLHRIQQQMNRMPVQLTQPGVLWAEPGA